MKEETKKEENKSKKDKSKGKKIKAKSDKPGRGIESMYRISMNNHVQFNKIADNKANILMSVNAIIISILLSTLLPSFLNGKHQVLIVPSIILLVTCMSTIITAVIATVPKDTRKYTDLSKVDNSHGKLLFFGNFSDMELQDYVKEMRAFQKDDKLVYDSLSQNFFILGRVLAVKYKYLHISYRIFMFGLIVSIIAFWISLVRFI